MCWALKEYKFCPNSLFQFVYINSLAIKCWSVRHRICCFVQCNSMLRACTIMCVYPQGTPDGWSEPSKKLFALKNLMMSLEVKTHSHASSSLDSCLRRWPYRYLTWKTAVIFFQSGRELGLVSLMSKRSAPAGGAKRACKAVKQEDQHLWADRLLSAARLENLQQTMYLKIIRQPASYQYMRKNIIFFTLQGVLWSWKSNILILFYVPV